MIVSEFIEWLKTQPQDAVVTCVEHTDSHNYYMQGGECSREYFSIDSESPTFDITDIVYEGERIHELLIGII